MSITAIRGTKSPLQQWYEESFDPSSGFTYRAGYQGLDDEEMQRLRNKFSQFGISTTLRNEFGISTLTLDDSTGNVLIDKWEMATDEEQPSMFENPLFLSLMNTAAQPQAAIAMLRNALQNTQDQADPTVDAGWFYLARPSTPNYYYTVGTGALDPGATTYTKNPVAVKFLNLLGAAFYGTWAIDGNWTSANMVKLKQYFDDYNLGRTNFIRGKYRLRHTTNAPSRWNANIADFNVEKIYTISQLLAECQNTNLWVLPLPGYLAYKILNYEVPPPRVNYIFGALKLRSNAVICANNRVEISTEYLIDACNTNLYPLI